MSVLVLGSINTQCKNTRTHNRISRALYWPEYTHTYSYWFSMYNKSVTKPIYIVLVDYPPSQSILFHYFILSFIVTHHKEQHMQLTYQGYMQRETFDLWYWWCYKVVKAENVSGVKLWILAWQGNLKLRLTEPNVVCRDPLKCYTETNCISCEQFEYRLFPFKLSGPAEPKESQ